MFILLSVQVRVPVQQLCRAAKRARGCSESVDDRRGLQRHRPATGGAGMDACSGPRHRPQGQRVLRGKVCHLCCIPEGLVSR